MLQQVPDTLNEKLCGMVPDLLLSLILRANDLGSLLVNTFESALTRWKHALVHRYVELLELISLTVSDIELAEDLSFQCLERHSSQVIAENPKITQGLGRSLLGIALNHIGEISDSSTKEMPVMLTKVKTRVVDGWLCEYTLRLDILAAVQPKLGDHIRLRPVGAPSNAPLHRPASIDALVTKTRTESGDP